MQEEYQQMDLIRLLIADDHAVVRQGLAAILSPRQGMEVIGQAKNGREAVQLAQELTPDVILMDLQMPEMDGIEATKAIHEQDPDARILVLTSFDEKEPAVAIMDAGAAGYLLKESGADELIQAIRSVHSGHGVMSPRMMKAMVSKSADQDLESKKISLTPREMDILQGIVDGLTNQAIAVRLDISSTTVRSHVSRILEKLEVDNRTQAALIAQKNHLL